MDGLKEVCQCFLFPCLRSVVGVLVSRLEYLFGCACFVKFPFSVRFFVFFFFELSAQLLPKRLYIFFG